ncbi:MAG TPA: UDP-N-acetylmuramoyl-L-alanyl-D-glutamate--2,6-diaminopimelate ligase [Solirubrobacteraceae bacterium]|nr:UDP-N-acetylmuramoyl-L-alanyl-D-glutamate--2,6-diaminopimelate ligase [Solirubrobacteraceae bacterium]
MRLQELAGDLASPVGGDPQITSLAYDSRRVEPGALFFCVSGFNVDGYEFAPAALAAGAAALVVEGRLELPVAQLVVPSVRAAMGPIADRFFGHPSHELAVVGVTGTNGKTTTAYLVRQLLADAGLQCGLLGTVKSVIGGVESDVVRTTPEAIDLHGDLRAMLDGGDRACAIEVSSHALALGRAAAVRFAAALFTNLTQDHLDFHSDMEDYFQAKRLLFVPEGPAPAHAVVNVADPYGERLAGELADVTTFAVDRDADYRARELECDLAGCTFTLDAEGASHRVRLPMPGRFNVANALGAFAAARVLGCDVDSLLQTLARGVRVPGRFEPVDAGQPYAVLVDYAHTPDSLQNVLAAAGDLVRAAAQGGRVICVFGAGGDRDRGKRPQMGAIAAAGADIAIVTSDNPRSEDPDAIIGEILAGTEGATNVTALADRRAAIELAVASAAPGDVLIIAGKGHERGQEFAGGKKLPFDDAQVALEALRSGRSAA